MWADDRIWNYVFIYTQHKRGQTKLVHIEDRSNQYQYRKTINNNVLSFIEQRHSGNYDFFLQERVVDLTKPILCPSTFVKKFITNETACTEPGSQPDREY